MLISEYQGEPGIGSETRSGPATRKDPATRTGPTIITGTRTKHKATLSPAAAGEFQKGVVCRISS